MKSKITKARIQQDCIQKQQELIDSFLKRKNEMYNDTFNQNTTHSQTEDRKGGKVELLNALDEELNFAQQELVFLNTIETTNVCEIIEPGAVVVTDQVTFFIGISSQKTDIDGEMVLGISPHAPIYANMGGLKKGESFQFNGTNYIIKDLY